MTHRQLANINVILLANNEKKITNVANQWAPSRGGGQAGVAWRQIVAGGVMWREISASGNGMKAENVI